MVSCVEPPCSCMELAWSCMNVHELTWTCTICMVYFLGNFLKNYVFFRFRFLRETTKKVGNFYFGTIFLAKNSMKFFLMKIVRTSILHRFVQKWKVSDIRNPPKTRIKFFASFHTFSRMNLQDHAWTCKNLASSHTCPCIMQAREIHTRSCTFMYVHARLCGSCWP